MPLITQINPKALIRVKGNLYTNIGNHIKDKDHTDFDNYLNINYYKNFSF
jgi:hypothetical protein